MNEYLEQYNEELKNQEKRANVRTVKSFFLVMLGAVIAWLLTMVGVFVVSKTALSITLVLAALMVIPAVYIYKNCDLSQKGYKYYFLTLICILCGMIMAFLSYHVYLLSVAPLLFAMQYRKKRVIRFVFIVNTITMILATLIGFYYGLCDINLLLSGVHTRNELIANVVSGADWIRFNENILFVIIVYVVLPRDLILFLFSVIVEYAIASGNEDAMQIAKLTYLKETDTNTHVFNKNKYLEMAADYYPEVDQIGVIFWDLNNLKRINDEFGHRVGDLAIETLSSLLNGFADEKSSIYRVGGDEFLLIAENPGTGACERMVESVKDSLRQESKHREYNVDVSAGIAIGNGVDILELVEEADEAMYEDKLRSKKNRA